MSISVQQISEEVTLESLGLVEPKGMSGGFEGASRTSHELASWAPTMTSPDVDLSFDKPVIDARSRDMDRNDGLAHGGVQIHRDGIVGSHFKLNSKPNWKVLGLSEDWASEFQQEVENKFTLYAESPNHWLDASRMNTLTALVRLVIGVYTVSGETLGTIEWLRDKGRPFNTAVQLVDSDRLSNPNDTMDSDKLRRGVRINKYGAPLGYHIRTSHPGDLFGTNINKWKYVPARKPWGRM